MHIGTLLSSGCQHLHGVFWRPCIGPWAPHPSQRLGKVRRWCIQHHPQGQQGHNASISKLHWSTYKTHHWATEWGGGHSFLGQIPQTQGEGIAVSVYRKPTHRDRYLVSESVCSEPDILAKETEHLNRVLRYNNYPQWMIDKWGKSDKHDPLIHPETGVEIQKHFYISVPYFPGLSESYKKIFKYTLIQVCFKGGEHS